MALKRCLWQVNVPNGWSSWAERWRPPSDIPYRDVFTFCPKEMPDIDPAIIEHKLNMDPTRKLIIQKKQHMGPEKAVAATVEV